MLRLHTHSAISRNFSSDVNLIVIDQEDVEIPLTVKSGTTLLDLCLDNELDVEGACGGECCCSTCHVYLPQDLCDSITEPDEDELDMLDLAIAVKDTSRLGCQITIDESFEGKKIQLPKECVNNSAV